MKQEKYLKTGFLSLFEDVRVPAVMAVTGYPNVELKDKPKLNFLSLDWLSFANVSNSHTKSNALH